MAVSSLQCMEEDSVRVRLELSVKAAKTKKKLRELLSLANYYTNKMGYETLGNGIYECQNLLYKPGKVIPSFIPSKNLDLF